MKIGLIQHDATSGDLQGNAAKLAAAVRRGGADLWVGTACALTGPLPACALADQDFARACVEAENRLARAIEDCAPFIFGGMRGPRLLQGGSAIVSSGEHHVAGRRILPLIMEDAVPPPGETAADLVCCLAAAPFSGAEIDYSSLRAYASANGTPLVFANLVGGYGERVYAGASRVLDGQGRLRGVAAAFREDALVVDPDEEFSPCPAPLWDKTGAVLDALVLGTRDFVRKSGAQAALLGLSGGMDSALVAAVAVEALGAENVAGLIMPSPFSSDHSVSDSLELAANLGMRTLRLPIGGLLESFGQALRAAYELFPARPGDLTLQNLQARIRSVLLSAASNRSGALVLNTGNKSEAAMGYFTLYGDSAGALAVIGDVYKTEVYKLAEEFNRRRGGDVIPRAIFEKAPSAELAPGQKDSDSLPPYPELDVTLRALLCGESAHDLRHGLFAREKLYGMEFKRRQCPPALIVSDHPLAACRRPLASRMSLSDAGRVSQD